MIDQSADQFDLNRWLNSGESNQCFDSYVYPNERPLLNDQQKEAIKSIKIPLPKRRFVRMIKYEWQIWANYGDGWEHETTEQTAQMAREQIALYRENAPGYGYKVVKARIGG
jgi:hypothetical protein